MTLILLLITSNPPSPQATQHPMSFISPSGIVVTHDTILNGNRRCFRISNIKGVVNDTHPQEHDVPVCVLLGTPAMVGIKAAV